MERVQGPPRQAAHAQENRRSALDLRGPQRRAAANRARPGTLRRLASCCRSGTPAAARAAEIASRERTSVSIRGEAGAWFDLRPQRCPRSARAVRTRGLGVASRRASIRSRQLRITLLGVLGQGPGDRRLVGARQTIQPRPAVQVLRRQLGRGAAFVGQHAREHLLVDDRQAVLVAVNARPPVEQLRRGVDRRHPAHDRTVDVLQVLDQAEVGHLDPPAHQQQVLGLDVEVLQGILLTDVIQGVGRVVQVGQQFVAGNAGQTGLAALFEFLLQARRGQLGDDQQVAVDPLDAFQRQQEGMADLLDAVQGGQFPRRPHVVAATVNDLDGLGQSAGGVGLPDLAIAAGPQALADQVARDRFRQRKRRGKSAVLMTYLSSHP